MNRFHCILLALLLAVPAWAQSFDPLKSYVIATPEGLVLDNRGSVQTEAGIVLSNSEADNAAQVWQIRPLGEGKYQLMNGHSFQGLDNANGATEHPVIQWSEEKDNPNQHWFISRNPDGTYSFISEPTRMALGLRKPGAFGDAVWQLKADAS